jgi:hypothetical protein
LINQLHRFAPGKFLTSSSKFQIKEVFTALISLAPATITKVSLGVQLPFGRWRD